MNWLGVQWTFNWLSVAVLAAGLGSAVLYGLRGGGLRRAADGEAAPHGAHGGGQRRVADGEAVQHGPHGGGQRHLADAGLALVAAVALAALLAAPVRTGHRADELVIASDVPDDALARALLAVPGAGALALTGHGLTEAQWQDLPARPLRWDAPKGDVLALEFARTVPLGRAFTLAVRRSQPVAGWRLQLLAENGQVLAESVDGVAASGAQAAMARAAPPVPTREAVREPSSAVPATQLSVTWLPPLAEQLVLRARLLERDGTTLAEGPVPLQVTEPVPLQVVGRFGAPSFDTRVLNDLLTASGAIVDWQTTLGKGLSRSEAARAALDHPHAQFIDAAWFEAASQPVRAALLGQVAQGLPLVVLGGNAGDAGVWQRELALPLAPHSPTTEKDDIRLFGAGTRQLALAPAGWNPPSQTGPAWRVLAGDSRGKPWLWQRRWQQGRIVWVGVADWHRHAIASPAALGVWWQNLFDMAVQGGAQDVSWEVPDAMPVAGMRTHVCALGVTAGAPLHVAGLPAMVWQQRSDRAEGVCAAFIPKRAGWHTLSSGAAQHGLYIYGGHDWPQWSKGLRQQATRTYMARTRTPIAVGAHYAPMPLWPLAAIFSLAMLVLWWRERRPAFST